jgi:hypothetical protein
MCAGSAPRDFLLTEDMTMRALLGATLILISVNAQAGVYCDSHTPSIYGQATAAGMLTARIKEAVGCVETFKTR